MELHKLYRRAFPSQKEVPASGVSEKLIEDTFHLAWDAFKKVSPKMSIIARAALSMHYGDTWNGDTKTAAMAQFDITEDEYEASIQARGGHYIWVRWTFDMPIASHVAVEDLSDEVKSMMRQVNGSLQHVYI